MSSVNVTIVNKSGKSVDKLLMYHDGTIPGTGDSLSDFEFVTCQVNLANNAQTPTIEVETEFLDPTDYWIGGVLFEGDGTPYIVSAETYIPPFKEYEVDDDGNLTITINKYVGQQANPSNMTFDDHTGDPEVAQLVNGTGASFLPWNFVKELIQQLEKKGC